MLTVEVLFLCAFCVFISIAAAQSNITEFQQNGTNVNATLTGRWHKHDHLCFTPAEIIAKFKSLSDMIQSARAKHVCDGRENALNCYPTAFWELGQGLSPRRVLEPQMTDTVQKIPRLGNILILPLVLKMVLLGQIYGLNSLFFCFIHNLACHLFFNIE